MLKHAVQIHYIYTCGASRIEEPLGVMSRPEPVRVVSCQFHLCLVDMLRTPQLQGIRVHDASSDGSWAILAIAASRKKTRGASLIPIECGAHAKGERELLAPSSYACNQFNL